MSTQANHQSSYLPSGCVFKWKNIFVVFEQSVVGWAKLKYIKLLL